MILLCVTTNPSSHPLTQLTDVQEVFDASTSRKDKKGNHDYRDSEYYMPYVQKDADTEKGLVDTAMLRFCV